MVAQLASPDPASRTAKEDEKGRALVHEARKFLTSIIKSAFQFKASDIHIRAGHHVTMRLDGRIRQVKGSPLMSDKMIQRLILPLMTPYHQALFKEQRQVDIALDDDQGNRVRANLYQSRGKLAVVMRVIENHIPTPEQLGLPESVRNISKLRQGIVIFSGATGSGKSTSMAALIDQINRERYAHILTIEDPIEFVFQEDRSIVSQREIGVDVFDFSQAMRAALREDPDVILMGEMRDAESIEIALNAAETGHLVFSSLHAPTSSDAITRMVSNFSGEEQKTIRAKLAYNLRSIVTQRLLPKNEGQGRTVACEVFNATPLARELILDPGRHQEIKDLIKGGDKVEGMLHFDEHLADLVKGNIISSEVALKNATSPTDLSLKLKGF